MPNESADKLSARTLESGRANRSLREELQAVEWYQERIDATGDPELRKILEHNRDEEKEHAALLIEYLRRRDENFAEELQKIVFSEKSLDELAEEN